MDPRELEFIQKQRGQAEFVHSIADQLGDAPLPGQSPPAPPASSPPLGVPVWVWAVAAVGVAYFVMRKD